jgi:two-component system sensor histidine kinase VanS
VHNAIVHNVPERGFVRVATGVEAGIAVLTVENTGEMLAPPVVATLVEPFRRGGTERVRSDHAGVGLGLAIVERITQAHDGTLTLAARPTGGLLVTVRLPATLSPAAAPLSVARAAPDAPARRRRARRPPP